MSLSDYISGKVGFYDAYIVHLTPGQYRTLGEIYNLNGIRCDGVKEEGDYLLVYWRKFGVHDVQIFDRYAYAAANQTMPTYSYIARIDNMRQLPVTGHNVPEVTIGQAVTGQVDSTDFLGEGCNYDFYKFVVPERGGSIIANFSAYDSQHNLKGLEFSLYHQWNFGGSLEYQDLGSSSVFYLTEGTYYLEIQNHQYPFEVVQPYRFVVNTSR